MLLEKLANDIAKAARNKSASDELAPMSYSDMLANDASAMAEAVPGAGALSAMAGLGGLASYGGLTAKRNLEKSVIDSLDWNVRAADLANKISENARANELLAGKGWASTQGDMLKQLARPENIARNTKATFSNGLLKLLRGAQKRKIL